VLSHCTRTRARLTALCPGLPGLLLLSHCVLHEMNWTDQSTQLHQALSWSCEQSNVTSHRPIRTDWLQTELTRSNSVPMGLFTLEFTFANSSSCDVNEVYVCILYSLLLHIHSIYSLYRLPDIDKVSCLLACNYSLMSFFHTVFCILQNIRICGE